MSSPSANPSVVAASSDAPSVVQVSADATKASGEAMDTVANDSFAAHPAAASEKKKPEPRIRIEVLLVNGDTVLLVKDADPKLRVWQLKQKLSAVLYDRAKKERDEEAAKRSDASAGADGTSADGADGEDFFLMAPPVSLLELSLQNPDVGCDNAAIDDSDSDSGDDSSKRGLLTGRYQLLREVAGVIESEPDPDSDTEGAARDVKHVDLHVVERQDEPALTTLSDFNDAFWELGLQRYTTADSIMHTRHVITILQKLASLPDEGTRLETAKSILNEEEGLDDTFRILWASIHEFCRRQNNAERFRQLLRRCGVASQLPGQGHEYLLFAAYLGADDMFAMLRENGLCGSQPPGKTLGRLEAELQAASRIAAKNPWRAVLENSCEPELGCFVNNEVVSSWDGVMELVDSDGCVVHECYNAGSKDIADALADADWLSGDHFTFRHFDDWEDGFADSYTPQRCFTLRGKEVTSAYLRAIDPE